ncbi:unnamed protein product, partial [Nesidiocoris tenuis]
MYLIWWRLESPPYLSVWQTAKKNCCSSVLLFVIRISKCLVSKQLYKKRFSTGYYPGFHISQHAVIPVYYGTTLCTLHLHISHYTPCHDKILQYTYFTLSHRR